MDQQTENYTAANLKYLRERNNLTLGEMAIRLRVNKNTYYNWESGKTEAPISTLHRIAELYHITLHQLCLQNANTICSV